MRATHVIASPSGTAGRTRFLGERQIFQGSDTLSLSGKDEYSTQKQAYPQMETILFLPCSSFEGKTDSSFPCWFYADLALSSDDAR